MDMGEAQGRLAVAARDVFEIFKVGNLTLCAAESCTGGLVGSSIVGISGASSIFKGSAVCYCDSSKTALLGVSPETISKFDAESPQCAEEMLKGAARIFESDAAISTTGFIDSNTGEKSPEKAHKVYVGILFRDTSKLLEFDLSSYGNRNLGREAVSLFAIEKLFELIKGEFEEYD